MPFAAQTIASARPGSCASEATSLPRQASHRCPAGWEESHRSECAGTWRSASRVLPLTPRGSGGLTRLGVCRLPLIWITKHDIQPCNSLSPHIPHSAQRCFIRMSYTLFRGLTSRLCSEGAGSGLPIGAFSPLSIPPFEGNRRRPGKRQNTSPAVPTWASPVELLGRSGIAAERALQWMQGAASASAEVQGKNAQRSSLGRAGIQQVTPAFGGPVALGVRSAVF